MNLLHFSIPKRPYTGQHIISNFTIDILILEHLDPNTSCAHDDL